MMDKEFYVIIVENNTWIFQYKKGKLKTGFYYRFSSDSKWVSNEGRAITDDSEAISTIKKATQYEINKLCIAIQSKYALIFNEYSKTFVADIYIEPLPKKSIEDRLTDIETKLEELLNPVECLK